MSNHCSKHFKYSDFTQCSTTQAKTLIANTAKDSRTIEAIKELANLILEPITDVTHPNAISIKILGYENT